MRSPRFQTGDRVYIQERPVGWGAGRLGTVSSRDPFRTRIDADVTSYWVQVDGFKTQSRIGESRLERARTENPTEQEPDMIKEVDPELALSDPDKYRRMSLARLITQELGRNGESVQPSAIAKLRLAEALLSDQVLAIIGLTDEETIALRKRHEKERADAEVVQRRKAAEREERRQERRSKLNELVQELNKKYPDLEPLHYSEPPTAD